MKAIRDIFIFRQIHILNLIFNSNHRVTDSSIYNDEFLKACVDEYLADGYIVKDLKALENYMKNELIVGDDITFDYGFSVVDDDEKPTFITYVCKCTDNDYESFISKKKDIWDNIGDYQWINTDGNGRFGSIDYDPESEVLIYFSEF